MNYQISDVSKLLFLMDTLLVYIDSSSLVEHQETKVKYFDAFFPFLFVWLSKEVNSEKGLLLYVFESKWTHETKNILLTFCQEMTCISNSLQFENFSVFTKYQLELSMRPFMSFWKYCQTWGIVELKKMLIGFGQDCLYRSQN